MGDVVNLNRFRKQRDRALKEAQAAENRVRFGRTKADKQKGGREQERAGTELDGKRLDDPE